MTTTVNLWEKHIENTELTSGLTGEPSVLNSAPNTQHPLVKETNYLAELGQRIMRQGGYCAITFPSRRRSTRGLRRGRRS